MDWLSYSRNNQEMVDKFTRLGIIESSEVERAFRCVSRAAFVPEVLLDDAFKDTPLRGSHHVHMSAPHMYAAILEELELDAGMSFLNVGSGTGYFSTLAGFILKKEGTNHGIEVYDDLVEFANEKVQCFLEHGPADVKEICHPVFIAGNCCRLDTEQTKYDRLYCGASCSQANVKFLLELVKVGGFLIAPVGSRLIKLKRVSIKEGRQSVINDVSFAPLIPSIPEEKRLPKLRFPDHCRKKGKESAIFCDVSFPVCKSPARKTLAQLRAFQDAMSCLQTGSPLPMPFCYVPCKQDLNTARGRPKTSRRDLKSSVDDELKGETAIDSQIHFFSNSPRDETSPLHCNGLNGSGTSPRVDSPKSADCRRKESAIDWEHISTDKTWFEILEHYYSLCATTEARRKECFKLTALNSCMQLEPSKMLTFKKYAKKMGLIPSKSSASSRGDLGTDLPKVEEVAGDIVTNLLEEVITQVDDNQSAEDFIAAITACGELRRRSSVTRAIVLDNLPRLSALSGDNKVSSSISDEKIGECASESGAENNVESMVMQIISDVDKQILNDITNSDSIAESDYGDHDSPNTNQQTLISTENAIAKPMNELSTAGLSHELKSVLESAIANDDFAFDIGCVAEDPITNSEESSVINDKGAIDDSRHGCHYIESTSLQQSVIETGNIATTVMNSILQGESIPLSQDNLIKEGTTNDSSTGSGEQSSFIFPVPGHASGTDNSAFKTPVTKDTPDFIPSETKTSISEPTGLAITEKKIQDTLDTHSTSSTILKSPCCTGTLYKTTSSRDGDHSTLLLYNTTDASEKNSQINENIRLSSFLRTRTESENLSPEDPTNAKELPCFKKCLPSTASHEIGSRFPNFSSPLLELRSKLIQNSTLNCSTESTPSHSAVQSDNFRSSLFNQENSEDSSHYDFLQSSCCSVGNDDGHPMDFNNSVMDTLLTRDKCFEQSIDRIVKEAQHDVSKNAQNSMEDCLAHNKSSVTISDHIDKEAKGTWPNESYDMDLGHSKSSHIDSFHPNDSLVASTPAQTSMENTEALARSLEEQHNETSQRLKSKDSPIMTSYSGSFKKRKKLRRRFTNVRMDIGSSELLRGLPGKLWNIKHDRELVLFLTRKENATGHVAFSPCCSNVLKPNYFTSKELMQFKNICSFPATTLASRAIALKRLAKVLDSVMNILVGPSLSRDQFRKASKDEFPLPSYSESSFESSGVPLKSGLNVKLDVDEAAKVEAEAEDKDRGLVDVMDKLIQQEINNVCDQKEIVFAKLNLYDKLNKEYEEQRKLISQQVDLIEEQQQLLQTRLRCKDPGDSTDETMRQTQKMLHERKSHRQQLAERREQIESQQLEKNTEHKALLLFYNQLTGMQNRLVKEQNMFLKKGRDYLEKVGGELATFSKFVAMSNELVNNSSAMNLDVKDEKLDCQKVKRRKNVQKCFGNPASKAFLENRYNPHLLLSKCRFLFPLTTKRLCVIKELLRSSETYSNHPCCSARVDRRIPLSERHKHPPSNTVFMQLYNALKNKELNYRDSKRSFEKLWEVKFIGEGIIDQGGGFRDSLAEIADELCPASPHVKPCLSLFTKTPNQRDEVGDHRDAYIPNPSCKDFHLFTWIGKLMGTAFRSDETIPVAFPPFIWKLLVGEHVAWATDFVGVDETVVRVTDGVELLDAATYEKDYGSEQSYMTHLSDGSEVHLIQNGGDVLVPANEREAFAAMVRKSRMLESSKQVDAIRQGLLTVVPESILSCLTWQDLERGICGLPEITLNDLIANCRYDLDLSANKDCVEKLWQCLTEFSSEERSKFIRFVTGRKRLPSPFYLSRSSTDGDDMLPTASTCGSNLFLPNYSSVAVAAEKIRYAINNCVSIDCDTSPW